MTVKKKWWLALGTLLGLAVLAVGLFGFKLYQRNAQGWVPRYLYALATGDHVSQTIDKATDIVFVFVDHHEHPFTEAEARSSAESWMRDYRKTIAGITDDYGRPFQYSWFYPFDGGRTPIALLDVNQLVYDGLGEIEFHWHNNETPNDQFEPNLKRGVDFFHGIGAMREYGPRARTRFGYIAGNWALDNGLGRKPGPSRELDYLSAAGCYADFTFVNTSVSQPSLYSSIYYAIDDDRARSYDRGTPARVGEHGKGFMMFQSPAAVDLKHLTLEIGVVEAWYGSDWDYRISLWFDDSPIVQGRPEWRFIKVYTHGVQSRELILSEKFRRLPLALKEFARQKKVRLHFVTAREAYNIVRAAEDGKEGDPQQYLDYDVGRYVNQFVHLDALAKDVWASDEALAITSPGESGPSKIVTKQGPVAAVNGHFNSLDARVADGKIVLKLDAAEAVSLVTRLPLAATPGVEVSACPTDAAQIFCYQWSPPATPPQKSASKR